jgi:hypothetical protein
MCCPGIATVTARTYQEWEMYSALGDDWQVSLSGGTSGVLSTLFDTKAGMMQYMNSLTSTGGGPANAGLPNIIATFNVATEANLLAANMFGGTTTVTVKFDQVPGGAFSTYAISASDELIGPGFMDGSMMDDGKPIGEFGGTFHRIKYERELLYFSPLFFLLVS